MSRSLPSRTKEGHMAMRSYIAFLEAAPGGGYGVYFPDVPGCVSAGDDLDDAVTNAKEALSLHLEGMAEDGELPEARTLQEIAQAGEFPTDVPGGLIYAAVSVDDPEGAERVNVYLPKSLLRQIERFGQRTGIDNRSTFLRLAARHYLSQGAADRGAPGSGVASDQGRQP